VTAQRAATPLPAAIPGTPASGSARRAVLLRVLAAAVLPLYLAGVTCFVVLGARLGTLGDSPVQGSLILVGFGCFAVLGSLVAYRRPRNALGWLLSAAALAVGWAPTGDSYAAWVMTTDGRPNGLAVLGAWVQSWYWYPLITVLLIWLPLLFPDGRLPSRRWRWITAVPVTGLAGITGLAMLTGTLTGQDVDYRIANPIGVAGLPQVEQSPAFGPLFVLVGVGVLEALAAVVVRFRRSRGDERQQMKVLLFAVAPLLLVPLEGVLPPVVGDAVFGWLLIAFPAAVAIAVLRYRLDGIDVVVNRALVYGTLTVLVVGFYVLIVGYLGAALGSRGDLTVELVATGVVAVLFAPLRDRVQRAVDRLLYGHRAEPYTALSRLGMRLEAALAPEAVLPTIVETVREALRLPYVAISVGGEDGERLVAAGEPVPSPARLPLLYRDEPVGELLLGGRPGEAAFSAADRRLLSDLARQAGVAVSTVRLTADLQRSRERLVGAREEERRRLRRDLHDGLGAQLAGLTVQAGLLRRLIPDDPAAAEALAGELRTELRGAIADIRRLVHGLRPPALDELGLAGALQRLAEATGAEPDGPRITVEAPDDLPALPAAVEVAAYRIVQEALTNVLRHAAARTCTVRLEVRAEHLLVTITDDGRGMPGEPGRAGVGMASMRERAAEMGGEVDIEDAPGGGVLVRATLPRSGGE
jgi:signal transduction histidine kinase